MTRAEMLTKLRGSMYLNDDVTPYFWSDLDLTAALSEGQDKFCEDTGFFVDTTNNTLTLQTGVAVYDIPDRVIQVIDIWDGNRRLEKDLTGRDEDDVTSTGPASRWHTDRDTGVIKIFPTPTSAENGDTLTLQVWRYSRYELAGFAADGESPAAPEIPGRYQYACLEWAAYKALNSHDLDKQDSAKADRHLQVYKDYVTQGIAAMRRLHNIETRVGTDPAYRT